MVKRVPLAEEPIADMDAVIQYDKGARYYIMPEYRYFAWKIRRMGIKSGRLLDIGTGSGRLAIELAKTKGCDFDITAIDISENMISRARENAKQAGVEAKIKFIVSTAASLPFPDHSFDLVVSYASLHHWFEPAAVFNETYRVTKEHGKAIIRDNKRVYQSRFWGFAVWLVSRFMNKRHRENWPRAILASYTIPEVKEILRQTRIKDYRVSSDFVGIDVCVEFPTGQSDINAKAKNYRDLSGQNHSVQFKAKIGRWHIRGFEAVHKRLIVMLSEAKHLGWGRKLSLIPPLPRDSSVASLPQNDIFSQPHFPLFAQYQ